MSTDWKLIVTNQKAHNMVQLRYVDHIYIYIYKQLPEMKFPFTHFSCGNTFLALDVT